MPQVTQFSFALGEIPGSILLWARPQGPELAVATPAGVDCLLFL